MDATQYANFLRGLGQQDAHRESVEATLKTYASIRNLRLDEQGQPSKLGSKLKEWVKNDPLEAQTRYVKEVLFDPMVKLLQPEYKEKLRGVPILVLPNRTVNGCAARAPNGEPLIIIDSGLLSMLSFWFERKFEALGFAETNSFEELVRFNETTYRFVIDYYKTRGKFAFPLPTPENTPARAFGASMLMTTASELFVLLHEIAHIVLGHLESSPVEHYSMFHSRDVGVDLYNHPWTVEYQADALAWIIYQTNWKSQETNWKFHELFSALVGTSNPILPKQAPLHFFEYVALVEKNVPYSNATPTHPPAFNRVKFLLELTEKALGDRELADAATEVLEFIDGVPVLPNGVNNA